MVVVGGSIPLVPTKHNCLQKESIMTIIREQDKESLEIIRHSTAHLLAQAVKILFPTAQVTIGPVIADGFYYDFAYERPFTPEDLQHIEQKMRELAAQNLIIARQELPRAAAIDFFLKQGEPYKVEIIRELPESEPISVYRQGDFTDLCRGPHVPSTGKLHAFKLMKVSGAYWRGNANNAALQRIYGTAWATEKELEAYLYRLAEAEKRDHRKIGKQQDLFHTQEEAPGMVFWHEKGWVLYRIIENYIRNQLKESGYQEVCTPQILEKSLWEKSGHWEKFGSLMFTTHSENHDYAIKPMNCPGHIQIYNQGLKSYRDLPVRLAEFGTCHRVEPSGTLHGLMRVRAFTQDDAHIFCTEEQIESEVFRFIDLLYQVYADFGFTEIGVKLSTRPDKRIGDDVIWDKAEQALRRALDGKQVKWELQPGEGAFYGPKIEFSLTDSLGRIWQCGTIQVDFFLPTRLGAHYVAEDSKKQVPVMLHRAILGSMERFIGVLLEHHAGFLPLWLAPIQIVILTITDKQQMYAKEIAKNLKDFDYRTVLDLRNEKIGFKIRDYTLQRIPFMVIIGAKEVETQQISVRTSRGEDEGSMLLSTFVERLSKILQ